MRDFRAKPTSLAEALGGVDGVLIRPAFFRRVGAGSSSTRISMENDRAIPVAETEFARDTTFGYAARTLPEWVAEKSGVRAAGEVASISLEDVRRGARR